MNAVEEMKRFDMTKRKADTISGLVTQNEIVF